MSDKKAQDMLTEVVAIAEARLKLWKSYLSQFRKILSAKKTARYYQIENKLLATVNYELANQIPLVKRQAAGTCSRYRRRRGKQTARFSRTF